MARLLVLQIVAFCIIFPRTYSGTNQNGSVLKLARRGLTDLPVGSNTSPDHSVVKAVGATAMGSLATAGVFTFFFRRCSARRRRRSRVDSAQRINIDELILKQQGRSSAGTIFEDDDDDDLDELDLIYWRKLESGQLARKVMVVNSVGEEVRTGFETEVAWNAKQYKVTTPRKLEHVPKDQAPVYPISQQPAVVSSVIAGPRRPAPPPPPSLTMTSPKKIPAPPPPPPLRKAPAQPPRSPILPVNRTPPKQTTRPNGVKLKRNLSVRPPPVPRRRSSSISVEKDFAEEENIDAAQVKLKPLHWDKVVANTEHSMVWDEINNGSFRFDDELMVSLFGYTYTASKEKVAGASSISGSKAGSSPAPGQEFILEPRKSQNIAIVLKSLSVSRKEILEALLNGEGLSTDQLEKLSALSPTQEETSKILKFDGNPTKLAAAESFLYHILKALPSAFTRIDAMLFRSVYDPEILNHKESLQTLELGCKELRNSEIFVRLLEAILKAGNKLNAGTARGNAQGFHLTALKKVADVKSVDGKTTLLHFVIEQVVRSEGKRCSCSPRTEASEPNLDGIENNEEKDKEYIILGLPILQGLSAQLSHVKKAAAIEHESFISVCPSLSHRVVEVKKLVSTCRDDKGGFVLEMKGFLEGCEEELKVVEAEQMRVLELVKRTTEYYQAGASKEKGTNPFQLFVIIKDFLDMVDQVCIGITRKSKAKNMAPAGTSPPPSPAVRNLLKLPDIQARFFHVQSKHSTSSDSDSDGEF